MYRQLSAATLAAILLLHAGSLTVAAEGKDQATPPASGEERLLADKEQERMMALATSQPADTTVLWLETRNESFLGLFQPANQPQPRGGILLLPHDRTSPDWPGSMQTLRRGLPDKGWSTLAIALPDQPAPLPPRFDKASDAAPSTGLPQQPERVEQRIETAIKTLRERGIQRIYLLGEGSGGYWAVRYLNNHAGQQLYPLLIDAERPNLTELPVLTELVSELQLPVIDLYHAEGVRPGDNERDAKLRSNAAKRAGLNQYRTVRMPPRLEDWRQTDPRLLSLVSGLIERHTERLLNSGRAAQASPPNR